VLVCAKSEKASWEMPTYANLVLQRVFLRDLALQRLPRIYRALYTMAERQGIELEEMPIVNFVDFRNGNRRS
jgi:hypothetical protein